MPWLHSTVAIPWRRSRADFACGEASPRRLLARGSEEGLEGASGGAQQPRELEHVPFPPPFPPPATAHSGVSALAGTRAVVEKVADGVGWTPGMPQQAAAAIGAAADLAAEHSGRQQPLEQAAYYCLIISALAAAVRVARAAVCGLQRLGGGSGSAQPGLAGAQGCAGAGERAGAARRWAWVCPRRVDVPFRKKVDVTDVTSMVTVS